MRRVELVSDDIIWLWNRGLAPTDTLHLANLALGSSFKLSQAKYFIWCKKLPSHSHNCIPVNERFEIFPV